MKSEDAKGGECGRVKVLEWAQGLNRKENEEDPGRRAARRDTRVVQGNVRRKLGVAGRGRRLVGGGRRGRRHIYLTCDATAPEFH